MIDIKDGDVVICNMDEAQRKTLFDRIQDSVPKKGTRGIVVDSSSYDDIIKVKWETGTTSDDGIWWIPKEYVTLAS